MLSLSQQQQCRATARPLVLAVVLAVLCTGCSREAEYLTTHDTADSFAEFRGRLVTARVILVVPDRKLTPVKQDKGWSFKGSATLLCHFNHELGSGLTFYVLPDKATAKREFLALWGGEPLWPRARRLDEQGEYLKVPASKTGKGIYRLTIEQVSKADQGAASATPTNRFLEVAYAQGLPSQRHPQHTFLPLQPQDISRYRLLSRFLEYGQVTKSNLRASGVLFDGPGATALDIVLNQASELSLMLENFSSSPAEFTGLVDASDEVFVVKPSQQRFVSVPVPAGEHRIELGVRGEQAGMFLLGVLHLDPRDELVRPPVVVITLDTTRRDALSPYQQHQSMTPTLADFASRATVYENAYSTAPWTVPTHASIFTGLMPYRHGAGVEEDRLRNDFTTVAELLQDHGYLTVGAPGSVMCSTGFGFAQGFSLFKHPTQGFEVTADTVTDTALSFIDSFGTKPLFMFLNYFDAHTKYTAPDRFQQQLGVDRLRKALINDPMWSEFAKGNWKAWKKISRGKVPLNPKALKLVRALYQAEVCFVDSQLERLFTALVEYDLFDKALIVVVADHGEMLGEKGRFGHTFLLDSELTNVPLIIKWPGQTQRRLDSHLVSQVDLFPTICEVAGVSPPPSQGISLVAGHDAQLASRSHLFIEEHVGPIHGFSPATFHVAKHLYGIQHLTYRETVWLGQISCEEKRGNTWVEVACSAAWDDRYQELNAVGIISETELEHLDSAELSEEKRTQLEQLGYL